MKQDISQSIAACAAHYGEDADAMRDYLVEGERNAYLINNRGEIRFDDNGDLAQDILDAYSKYGFYVFEGAHDIAVKTLQNNLKYFPRFPGPPPPLLALHITRAVRGFLMATCLRQHTC